MSKVFVRSCVILVAASLVLALTPLPVRAAGLADHAARPSTAAWSDAALAWMHALLAPTLTAPARSALGSATLLRHSSRHHPARWLHPTCDPGTAIDPNGHCI